MDILAITNIISTTIFMTTLLWLLYTDPKAKAYPRDTLPKYSFCGLCDDNTGSEAAYRGSQDTPLHNFRAQF